MSGTLALVGGGEWGADCQSFDAEFLSTAGADEVVVLTSAAAFEHPDRVADRATAYFEGLGAKVYAPLVLRRHEANDATVVDRVRTARFIYLSDGSPLHLRSVLKGSPLFDAILSAFHGGSVLAASGAGATLVGDPMVDPRGGAYTVGLGVVTGLAVFPYHGSATGHLLDRSIDLLPAGAKLVGIDEQTALIRDRSGDWRVAGTGTVTVYDGADKRSFTTGAVVEALGA